MARPTRVRRADDGTVRPVNTSAGAVDPATGGRWQGGGTPRHTDGTPMTAEEIRAEMDGTARAPKASRPAAFGPGRRPRGRGGRRASWSPATLGGRALAPLRGETDATGFVLALLLWGWVALPMLQGGPDAVRDVVRAKFVNKGPNGKWLP